MHSPAVSKISETVQIPSLDISGCIAARLRRCAAVWLTAVSALPPSPWQDTLNRPHNSDVQPLIHREGDSRDNTKQTTMTNGFKKTKEKTIHQHWLMCNLRESLTLCKHLEKWIICAVCLSAWRLGLPPAAVWRQRRPATPPCITKAAAASHAGAFRAQGLHTVTSLVTLFWQLDDGFWMWWFVCVCVFYCQQYALNTPQVMEGHFLLV